jgi:SAM-dependent methyltransferase
MKSLKEMLQLSTITGYFKNADSFARGRPGYPPAANDWLIRDLQIKHHSVVLDLGAGTGKFTPRLLDIGAKVIAVEPVAEMREKFSTRYPEIELLEGSAQSLPLKSGSVDAVVCAHSFHWFADRDSMAEIYRVLKPGGRLGMIWNLRDASVDWVGQVAAIVSAVAGDSPRFYSQEWRKVFPFTGFSPLNERHVHHGHTGLPEDVILNRVKSISFVGNLPEAEQQRVYAEVQQIIATHPDLAGKDSVTVPYDTVAFHTVKIL